MKKLFAIDLDGTLFYPKHPISILKEKTISIIRKIIDGGDIFAIVSGRNINSCKNVFSLIERDPYIIGCNGAYIFEKDKFVKNETLDSTIFYEIYDYIDKNHKTIAKYVMAEDGKFVLEEKMPTIFYRFGQKIYDAMQGKLLENYVINRELFNETASKNKVRKFMVMYGISNKAKELARIATEDLQKKFGSKVEICWSNQAVEISPKGCSKAAGILELSKKLNIKNENIIVMGDSGNDIPMFQEFYENSYCIAKANINVKKHAKHIIRRFDDIEKEI